MYTFVASTLKQGKFELFNSVWKCVHSSAEGFNTVGDYPNNS